MEPTVLPNTTTLGMGTGTRAQARSRKEIGDLGEQNSVFSELLVSGFEFLKLYNYL